MMAWVFEVRLVLLVIFLGVVPQAWTTTPPCGTESAPCSSDVPIAQTTPSKCSSASPQWKLTWQDTFSDSSLNQSNWNVYNNMTHGDRELQLYLADDVYVEKGNLVLRTRFNPTMYGSKRYNWTSGWVDTEHKIWQRFGRFEVRAKLPNPKSQRIWPAHWLMPEPETSVPPNVCWPVGGEIDILESYGQMYNDTAQGTFHFAEQCNQDLRAGPNGRFPNISGGAREIDFSQDYHIFAVEWDTNCIKWFVDEHQYWQRWTDDEPAPHGARIPQTPFYFILNTAISWWSDSDGDFNPLMPVYHYIDHVKIFEAVGA